MQDKFIGTAKLKTYIQITRITIVICWISLLAFWAIKLFGGNFFEIVVENDNFVKFSEKVETTWLKYLVSFITMGIGNYFIFSSISQRFVLRNKNLVIYIISLISIWSVVHFVPNEVIKMFFGYIVIIIYGIVMQKGAKRLFGILAISLELCFMILSMITRNVEVWLVYDYMISLILSIDIYIMYFLYYLYSNLIRLKKEI